MQRTMLNVSGFSEHTISELNADSTSPVEITLKNLVCYNIQSDDPKKLRRNVNYTLSDTDLQMKHFMLKDLRTNLKYLELCIKNYKQFSRNKINFSNIFIKNSNYSSTTNNPSTNFHKIIGVSPSLCRMRELYRINHVLRSLLLGTKLNQIDVNFITAHVNGSCYNSHLIDALFEIFDNYNQVKLPSE